MADENATETAGPADAAALAAAAEELGRTLDGIRRTARGISGDLADGLKAAVVEGERLDGVLAGLAERLNARFLDVALAPLERIVAQGIGAAAGTAGAATGSAGGLASAVGGAAATVAGVALAPGVTGDATMAAAAGRVGASGGGGLGGAGRAGGIGAGGGGAGGREAAAAPVSVTLNVTSPDAESFRRSEARMTALLARAVGRGRRGL